MPWPFTFIAKIILPGQQQNNQLWYETKDEVAIDYLSFNKIMEFKYQEIKVRVQYMKTVIH